MKKFLIGCCLLVGVQTLQAQRVTDILFSYLVQPGNAVDSATPYIVSAGGYSGQIVQSMHVSENPKERAALLALIKKLKANGSADINKCFIPRHCITLLNNDTVVYHILVCFECDGVRFSNEKKTTRVKSVEYREKAMATLKTYFTRFHFNEKGL